MEPVRYCLSVLKKSRSNMAAAILALPKERRNELAAFYAFCREVDDIADNATHIDATTELSRWRRRIEEAYIGIDPADPVMSALMPVLIRQAVPREWLLDVIDGVSWDLQKTRYSTFEELYEYCYKVAGVVGLVCTRILGLKGRDVDMYAEHLGIAMQLTNIMRDVSEDAGRGRIYIPLEDLQDYGVSEQDILEDRTSQNRLRLMAFEAARAREYYAMAKAALSPSKRRSFYFGEILRETYSSLLDRLEEKGFDSYDGGGTRNTLPVWLRAGIAVKRKMIAVAVERF